LGICILAHAVSANTQQPQNNFNSSFDNNGGLHSVVMEVSYRWFNDIMELIISSGVIKASAMLYSEQNNIRSITNPDVEMITFHHERYDLLRKFLILVIILVFIVLFLLYRKLRYISKINQQLEQKQEEIINANKQLYDLNKMRDKLFSIISHDLRNPFMSIVSFTRIIKRDINELGKDELQELSVELDRSVAKINDLLDNLLHWSMAHTGKITCKPEFVLLSGLVEEIVDLFLTAAREKGVTIYNNINKDMVAWADVTMTNSIIRNLLSNAIKYVDQGGIVTLAAQRVGNMIHISVADTGVGISNESKTKLFNPESLLSTYGTKDEKGSGLGLLICKEFAERQGGRIWFDSEPGKGSQFFFSLPAEK
jgi:signal transduction histidine kinase